MTGIEGIIGRQLRRWEADKALRAELERELKIQPPAQRVITVSRAHGSEECLAEKEAEREVRAVDDERRKFVRKIWKRDVDDPTTYDLTINRAHMTIEAVTRVIGNAALEKFDQLAGVEAS